MNCLSGHFAAYRIKCRTEDAWIPILASTDLVKTFNAKDLSSLHHLYLFSADDQYLSTLLLRAFPKRRLIYVPDASFEVHVPETYEDLFIKSKKRLNGKIHNLLELLISPGSMHYTTRLIMFQELTDIFLSPAIVLFFFRQLLFGSANSTLILLSTVLFLPQLLVTTTNLSLDSLHLLLVSYLSFPFWLFILPIYSFWTVDSVDLGEMSTGGSDVVPESLVPFCHWAEWESQRRLMK